MKSTIKLVSLLLIFIVAITSCKSKSSDEGKVKPIEKTLKLSILNDGKADKILYAKMEEEMEGVYKIVTKNEYLLCEGTSTYKYSHSDNTKRVICDFTLQYDVIEISTKKSISSTTKKTLGTGFSEKEAKKNAVAKLKLY